MNTQIYVCTHKEFHMPADADTALYAPLHVGRAISGDLGYPGDDTGNSISEKNKSFCELTGLYWIWKNTDCDIVGLCHYRRFFERDGRLLSQTDIEKALTEDGYDIIAPASGFTEYLSNRMHYEKVHFPKDYLLLREVLAEKYPTYLAAFDHFSHTNLASLANMVITRKEIFDSYCAWLFDILFEMERRTDLTSYSPFQARLYGYLSERLFRVWLFMQEYKVKEESVRLIDEVMPQGRLILFQGVHDTLDLFTQELCDALSGMGYDCLLLDTNDMNASLIRLSEFIKEPVRSAITFNNLAFNMELSPGENVWEALGIPIVNILVDHPFCFSNALAHAPSNAIVLTIDKKHMAYVSRFYPNIPVTGFLPHGGRAVCPFVRNIIDRSIDVLYAGGISTEFIAQIMPDFTEFPFDAKAIGEDAYHRMLKQPSLTTEEALEQSLLAKAIRLSDEDLREFIAKMRYVDMQIVTYYREKTLRTLAENGISLTIYGVGWGSYDWIRLPNVDYHARIPVSQVFPYMEDAKIVLNTMTWFKDGTHERIFNGMLQGAVAVSDSSIYMKESFLYTPVVQPEDSELVLFELNEIDRLPGRIRTLLDHPALMQMIADNGRRRAMITETWKARAQELHRDLLCQL